VHGAGATKARATTLGHCPTASVSHLGAANMAEEVTFYSDDDGVRVTSARLIIGNVTYSMANIASVSADVTKPKPEGPLLAIIAGFFLAVGSMATGNAGLAIIGVLVILGGIFYWKNLKSTWHLKISSSSGESTPLSSENKVRVESISHAIHEAMIHRG
jgi:hypothetical protein